MRKIKNTQNYCDKSRNRKAPKMIAKDAKFNFLSNDSCFVALGAELTELWPIF